MHEYRTAFNEEKLKAVAQYKYDNNFHNWEDPKVLEYFMNTFQVLSKGTEILYEEPKECEEGFQEDLWLSLCQPQYLGWKLYQSTEQHKVFSKMCGICKFLSLVLSALKIVFFPGAIQLC